MKKIMLLLVIILVLSSIGNIAFGIDTEAPPGPDWRDRWDDILKDRAPNPIVRWIGIISIVANLALLFILLIIYMQNFRKTKSFFMLGLSFFVGVLLLQKILFYYLPTLPQFFETMALSILLMLSLD